MVHGLQDVDEGVRREEDGAGSHCRVLGAATEQEPFEALNYPIRMESKITGKDNWSLMQCLEVVIQEERVIRNGTGMLFWLCQPTEKRCTTYNDGLSGPPVIARLGTTDKTKRFQTIKAYVIRSCTEFDQLAGCERKFLKMTERPKISIPPQQVSERDRLKQWQLINPHFMFVPQVRSSHVTTSLKWMGFMNSQGCIRFSDVVHSPEFLGYVAEVDADFHKEKYWMVTPFDKPQEVPGEDAPEHCGYIVQNSWIVDGVKAGIDQSRLEESNDAEGDYTGAQKQKSAIPHTHMMPQELQARHQLGGPGRFRFRGRLFEMEENINLDDGWKLQKDGARKDPDSNMVVHPAVSIAGGYNTVASVMLEAIPYVMSTMSYRSQEYSTDCEDNPFSMHMSNDQ